VLGRIACIAFASALMLALASPAAGAAPCWQKLMTDWYDGTIDGTYPVPCYHQAIERLPTDLELYSSARDDILRALQAATVPEEEAPPPAETTSTQPLKPASTAPATTGQTTTTSTPSAPPEQPEAVPQASPGTTSDDSDSLPVPLLVLGGLALLLVATGGGAMLWRHYRGGPGTP
jgi:hypothetical protein